MINKGICDTGFLWNPSNWKGECDKSCDVGEYSNKENCKCRKKIIDKLVEECNKEITGNKMIYDATLSNYRNVCNSSITSIILVF